MTSVARAVVFDVDGTLLDSNDGHARAWVEAMARYGHNLLFADVRRQIGKGGDQLMPTFLSEAEIARFGEKLERARGEIFKQRYLPSVHPFPDVRPLLKALLGKGIRLALASSASEPELEHYKRLAHIDDLIQAEASSDDARHSKPNPDIFVAALERLQGLSPEQVLAVGDTPYDAEAATKAGIKAIGVTCGGWSAADLERGGCTQVYAGPTALLADLDAWLELPE